MTDRIVIIFAYHFPPESSIGGMRPYRFYKWLSRMGYKCHVITAADQASRPDPNTEYVPDPFVTGPRKGIGWQIERAVRRFLLPGTTGIQWSRLAYRAARRVVRANPTAEFTIFSTYPPLGVHLAAYLLARSTSFSWIADYRDPLADNPGHASFAPFQLRMYSALDRLFFREAQAVIANTDASAEKLKATYRDGAKRIHVIWNGFDPDQRILPLSLPQRTYKVYSHVGELYFGRSITGILESVSRLIDAGRIDADRLRIHLAGWANEDSVPPKEFLDRAQARGWLQLALHEVPLDDARRLAQTSDGLLLVQPHSAVQVPGKLFEYIQIGRPVLAYILPDTPIEHILRSSGIPYVCAYAGTSNDVIDDAVERFLRMPSDPVAASDWFDRNFDAREQTRTLAAIIDSLHTKVQ